MAKTPSKQSAKKAPKKAMTGKCSKKCIESWSTYIYRIIKQVHPDTGISKKGMSIMNSFINAIFDRIASEAGRLNTFSKKATLSSRKIQTAIRLMAVAWRTCQARRERVYQGCHQIFELFLNQCDAMISYRK
jgi:histone H2B